MSRVSAVIVAAGSGSRFDTDLKKQFVDICGKPTLTWTVEAFLLCSYIDEVVVVVATEDVEFCKREVLNLEYSSKPVRVVSGGIDRQESVYNGVMAVTPETEIVAIHDGVRPLIKPRIIGECVEAAVRRGASCAAVPVTNTIKRVRGNDDNFIITETVDRSALWEAQTPQCFRLDIILKALAVAEKSGYRGTDDAALVEMLGENVAIVMGSYENIKITTPIDIELAKRILSGKQGT